MTGKVCTEMIFWYSDEDGFEYGIPEELREWFESRSERIRRDFLKTYTFKNGKIEATDFLAGAMWWEQNPDARTVDKTDIDDVHVSTVFLHIDHNFGFGEEKRPVLFETMVFGGDYDQYQRRYCTFGEAKQGHWETVDGIRNGNLYDEETE